MALAGRVPTFARSDGRASVLATDSLRCGEVRDVARRLNDLSHDDGLELMRLETAAGPLVRPVFDALPPAARRTARLHAVVKRRFVLAPGAEEPDEYRMQAMQVTGLSPDNLAALLLRLVVSLPLFADLRVRGLVLGDPVAAWPRRWLWIRRTTSGYVEQIMQTWRRGAVPVRLLPMTTQTYKIGPILPLTHLWDEAILRANMTYRGMMAIRRCGRLVGWVDEHEPPRTHWRPFL